MLVTQKWIHILLMCVYAMVTSFIYSPSLAENAIGNKGAKALSRALLVNRTLTSLK